MKRSFLCLAGAAFLLGQLAADDSRPASGGYITITPPPRPNSDHKIIIPSLSNTLDPVSTDAVLPPQQR